MIQPLFDDPDNLHDEIVETEECDDKICQNIDYVHRFVQRKTRHSSQESSFAAGSTTISRNIENINLPKLDLPSFSGDYLDWISFYDRFKGAVIDNDQLTNSLRSQYLKSAVKREASKMLTSITVTDNFDVAMEILQNRYDNRRLILRAHIHWIVSYRPVLQENTGELRKLVDKMEEHRLSPRNMGQPVEHQDPFFVYLIAEKLPTETQKFWEISSKRKELQTDQELKTFLEERVKALESTAPSYSSSNTKKRSHTQQNQPQRQLHTHVTTTNQQCECCDEEHRIFKCGKFKGLGVKERAQLIKVKGVCFYCLRPGHRSESCDGSSCRQCGRKHHTLLHREDAHLVNQLKKSFGNSGKANAREQEKVTFRASSSNAEQITIDQKITAALTHEQKTQENYLQTAIVPVNVQGEIVYLRAILDSAFQNNLVTEAAVQRLQLKRKRNNTRVFGLGGNEVSTNCGFVDLCLPPKNKAPIIIYASVLKKMTNDLSSRFINTDNWETVKELQLADPDFNKPAQIDLIIGAGHYEDLMVGNNRLKEPNTPLLIGSQYSIG